MSIITCWDKHYQDLNMQKDLKLLIDFGGTHFRYMIKERDKTILQNSINSDDIELVEFLTNTLSKNDKIKFVGISFGGQVQNGTILSAPNINISYKNIKQYIESKFEVLVEIDNDLKVAALAEKTLYDIKSAVILSMGTGFGGAIVENGKIIRGANNLAGEIGHIPFKKAPFVCGCGKDNCVELFASGSALKKWIEFYDIKISTPTIKELSKLNTKESSEILNNFHDALIHAVATITTLLNPSYMILGGSVFLNNEYLVDFLNSNLKTKCFQPALKELKITLSKHSNASLIGADILHKQKRKLSMEMLHNKELYSKKVAYFSMEFALDQALKIYSGGLGFLAGSHMRSAYELKQNMIGVGMLWSYGYYDQEREADQSMRAAYTRKTYQYLDDPNVTITVSINNRPVYVKVYLLKSEVFQSAPMVLLSTDIEQNDHLSRTITSRLYDGNHETRIAQEIVLGVGGLKALEALNEEIDIYHMNEGHAVALAFKLYEKYQDIDEVKKRVVFTTHTPEAAGNEEHSIELLHRMGFFSSLDIKTIRDITNTTGEMFSLTVGALKLSKISNAVSKIHKKVANDMWKDVLDEDEKIISITNAQNRRYWQDKGLLRAYDDNVDYEIVARKKHLKRMLFNVVANQTGKIFNPDILTIVWARRFAEYKRPGLLKYDFERFLKVVHNKSKPVQIIWAGKPYPTDGTAVSIFNELVYLSKDIKNIALLTGYELELSAILKKGADVWINTPRINREASGTSGMSASMNGAIHFSIPDGWHPEFAKHGINSFTIPGCDENLSTEEQDKLDNKNMMDVLENEIIPIYYDDQKRWVNIIKNAMHDVLPYFDSNRMAHEYYEKMYNFEHRNIKKL